MVLLKVVSDLHLNKPHVNVEDVLNSIKPIASKNNETTVLAILGDIGSNYDDLFRHVKSLRYTYVLFVAGNHEYYGHVYQRRNIALNRLCKKYGILFMNRNSIVIDNIIFAGTTLWTYIPTHLRLSASEDLKEVRLIKYGMSKMTVDRYIDMNKKDVQWIKDMIKSSSDSEKKIVVLTHHAPSLKLCRYCNHGEQSNDISVYFASDLDDLVEMTELWCCGHIHDFTNKDGVVINPYPSKDFDPDIVINLSM